MEPNDGYFCRAYVGQDVQANVIARTLREAELEDGNGHSDDTVVEPAEAPARRGRHSGT